MRWILVLTFVDELTMLFRSRKEHIKVTPCYGKVIPPRIDP
jgi:hypothetical protein